MKSLILCRPVHILNFTGDTDFDLRQKERGRNKPRMSTLRHPFLIVSKEWFCKTAAAHNMLFGKSTLSGRRLFCRQRTVVWASV